MSVKLLTKGPCNTFAPYLAASKGFCPPLLIIEPPKNTLAPNL